MVEIFAGCRQPEGGIPVTPDSVFVLAGLMANELLQNLAGTPKLLDRFLVVDLDGFIFLRCETGKLLGKEAGLDG
jgi:predicted acyltransferase